jgi:hypothetical protein
MADQESFDIKIEPDTLIRRDSGSIIGRIWITIGNWAFPSVAWDDFPVVILSWWIETLLRVSSEGSESGKCYFMDGPFWFEINKQEDGLSMVRFYRDSKAESKILRDQRCKISIVTEAVLSAASATIAACHERNWNSTDLDNLVEAYSNLRMFSRS